jgi:hypothetical protein
VNKFEVETMSALEPLRPEWTQLACCTRSVVTTWEWLSTWWDHVGRLGPVCAPDDRPDMARALGRVLADWRCHLLLAEQLPADDKWGALLAGRVLAREGNPVLRFGAEGWKDFLRQRAGRDPRWDRFTSASWSMGRWFHR